MSAEAGLLTGEKLLIPGGLLPGLFEGATQDRLRRLSSPDGFPCMAPLGQKLPLSMA